MLTENSGQRAASRTEDAVENAGQRAVLTENSGQRAVLTEDAVENAGQRACCSPRIPGSERRLTEDAVENAGQPSGAHRGCRRERRAASGAHREFLGSERCSPRFWAASGAHREFRAASGACTENFGQRAVATGGARRGGPPLFER